MNFFYCSLELFIKYKIYVVTYYECMLTFADYRKFICHNFSVHTSLN